MRFLCRLGIHTSCTSDAVKVQTELAPQEKVLALQLLEECREVFLQNDLPEHLLKYDTEVKDASVIVRQCTQCGEYLQTHYITHIS